MFVCFFLLLILSCFVELLFLFYQVFFWFVLLLVVWKVHKHLHGKIQLEKIDWWHIREYIDDPKVKKLLRQRICNFVVVVKYSETSIEQPCRQFLKGRHKKASNVCKYILIFVSNIYLLDFYSTKPIITFYILQQWIHVNILVRMISLDFL